MLTLAIVAIILSSLEMVNRLKDVLDAGVHIGTLLDGKLRGKKINGGIMDLKYEDKIDRLQKLRKKTGCGILDARKALEERDWDMEFAEEYLRRATLAVVCSESTRFPIWTKYIKTLRKEI